MTCAFCGGPAHPATGCVYGARTIACYRCTVEAWAWVRRWTGASQRMPDGTRRYFYEAAGSDTLSGQ